jgi:hypothetical protein
MSKRSEPKLEPIADHVLQVVGTGMRISPLVLERVCKKMIKMILYCLPHASRGTIYSVGPFPDLRVIRIASGCRNVQTDEINWDGASRSDYDLPGKVWKDYRDRPGGILEAMAWCIERQKSWTADIPEHDCRSVRKQLEGTAGEDYHHMEPVLVTKTDLWEIMPPPKGYPKDCLGKPIWQDSPYATVAVIKIHFQPGTINRGDRSTVIIKELSQSLGTEMLSLHAREIALEKEKSLVTSRHDTCNAIAHEFRNIITRIGFAYRIVNNEIGYLRELWEDLVQEHLPRQSRKRAILQKLGTILENVQVKYCNANISNETVRLAQYQKQLIDSSLLPQQNEMCLQQKIKPLWSSVISKLDLDNSLRNEIETLLEKLRLSFYIVLNHRVVNTIHLSNDMKAKWVELAYCEINGKDNVDISSYIEWLDNLNLKLPHKKQSIKNFIYLKELIELVPEIEKRLNHRLELIKRSE